MVVRSRASVMRRQVGNLAKKAEVHSSNDSYWTVRARIMKGSSRINWLTWLSNKSSGRNHQRGLYPPTVFLAVNLCTLVQVLITSLRRVLGKT